MIKGRKLAGIILTAAMLIGSFGNVAYAEENESYAEETIITEEQDDILDTADTEEQNDVSDTADTEEQNDVLDTTDTEEQDDAINQIDEANQADEKEIIYIDENGNVTEGDDEPHVVEDQISFFTANEQIVNFNTKGNATTDYTEVGTGASGYTNGASGADAAYLKTEGGMVYFMQAGVIGKVKSEEVQVMSLSQAKSMSDYSVSNGRLYHNISTDMTTPGYASRVNHGPAPSYLQTGINYYSYDGHYFYTDYSVMLRDYRQDTRVNSVNPSSPFYNYYQYLPLRSASNYTQGELNSIVNGRCGSGSKMYNTGSHMVDMQNTYGVNALTIAAAAAIESAWGNSSIAQSKNNLFGINAVDTSPGQSATVFSSPQACIKDFAETYMSKRYLRPGWSYYHGGFLGNKASGINVSYASNPYWGEFIAAIMWELDGNNGSKDAGKYAIGVKDLYSNQHTQLNVRKESNTGSQVLYQTGQWSQFAFLLRNSTPINGFYQIQSDAVLNSLRNGVNANSGNYDFNSMYAYVSSDFVSKVSVGMGNITGSQTPSVEVPFYLENNLTATAHVAEIGWQDSANNGQAIGTVGLALPMEAVKIKIEGIPELEIEYQAYVAGLGWLPYVSNGEEGGTTGQSREMQAVRIRLKGAAASRYQIYYRAHVAGAGWLSYVSNNEVAGTTGENKSLQSLQIVLLEKGENVTVPSENLISYETYNPILGWAGSCVTNGKQSGTVGLGGSIEELRIISERADLGVEYSAHVPNAGWLDYVGSGTTISGKGDPKRIEAVKIRLTGMGAQNYDVYYRTHIANHGWLDWTKNDAMSGSTGLKCSIEAIQIAVLTKGSAAPGKMDVPFIEAPIEVRYSGHVQDDGWHSEVSNGEVSGTIGESKRVEAMQIYLVNNTLGGGIEYRTHVQNVGWQSECSNGQTAGTEGQGLQMEAIRIKLTGEIAERYDVYYRTHVQNIGWLSWAKNGEAAGTEGCGYRLEALQIQLIKKGEGIPGDMSVPFKQKSAGIVYTTHVQNYGWQPEIADGILSGTEGESLRLEAIGVRLSEQKYTGNIQYTTHVQNDGWQQIVSDGEISGTVGESKRLEAIRINLTGDMAQKYNVSYRVHVQDDGWQDWVQNGEQAGTTGESKRLEAIQIQLIEK